MKKQVIHVERDKLQGFRGRVYQDGCRPSVFEEKRNNSKKERKKLKAKLSRGRYEEE